MQKGGKIAEHIKLLGAGAYSCIFKIEEAIPSAEPEFITKIQRKKSVSDNETDIGKKIMKIKHYDDYFAPVIKSEKISMASINDDEIEQCEFLHEDSTKKNTQNALYESNQVLYVGKLTLGNYLTKMASMEPNQFIGIFISSHIILLEGLQKLVGANIIHYDLRENNIMVRDADGRPIFIDFGLSIDTTVEFKPDDAFYIYYNEYAPWCIDIVVLSYIVNELGDDWKTKTATTTEMSKLIDEYINKNKGLKILLIPDERLTLKTKLVSFFNKYDNKPWQNVYDELLKYRNSWDNYALSVIFLLLFDDLNLSQYIGEYPFLDSYKNLLKSVILSSPSERALPKDIIIQINKIFGNIQRVVHKNFQRHLTQDFSVPDKIKELEKNVAKSMLLDQETEKRVYA